MSASIGHRENRAFASEIKFMVPEVLVTQISRWARERLRPDPYASPEYDDGYLVASIYFDTEHFDVFHKRGSFGRSKYRIRRYGKGDFVFLERKLKTREMVSKRRARMSVNDLPSIEAEELDADWSRRWFQQRLNVRRLRPVCQVAYRRSALVAITDNGPIRLTIDRELHALPRANICFGDSGTPILENKAIVEMKFAVAIPLMFKLLLEEFALVPQGHSKYRSAVAGLDLVKDGTAPQLPLITHISP